MICQVHDGLLCYAFVFLYVSNAVQNGMCGEIKKNKKWFIWCMFFEYEQKVDSQQYLFALVNFLMLRHWQCCFVWQTSASNHHCRASLQRNVLVFDSFKRKPMRPAWLFLCCQKILRSLASLVNRLFYLKIIIALLPHY